MASQHSEQRPRRRFLPELVETTKRSSHDQSASAGPGTTVDNDSEHKMDIDAKEQDQQRGPEKRRVLPQPVELSKWSNRKAHHDISAAEQGHTGSSSSSSPTLTTVRLNHASPHALSIRHKSDVQPVERPETANRKQTDTEMKDVNTADASQSSSQEPPTRDQRRQTPPRRKFKPMLIETSKRSHKSGDASPALLPQDKTNASPGDPSDPWAAAPHRSPNSLAVLRRAPQRQEFFYPHHPTRVNTRQHSYQVPDLEAIESSESSESEATSLAKTKTTSPPTDEDTYKDATRMRESADETVSGYLLALAAKAAEKQLREQEAAVFPNTDFHEPVAHYVDKSDSGDEPSNTSVGRRNYSSDEEKAAFGDMQRHAERNQATPLQAIAAIAANPVATAPTSASRNSAGLDLDKDSNVAQQHGRQHAPAPAKATGNHQRDHVLKQMRKAASPPMLGGSIDFPRCRSPDHARFDVTQGAAFLRNSMCYTDGNIDGDQAGLWGRAAAKEQEPATTWNMGSKTDTARKPAGADGGGLWGGHCTELDARMPPAPTGLVTPRRTPTKEKPDPFGMLNMTNLSTTPRIPPGRESSQLPPSPPPASKAMGEPLHQRLQMELQKEQEALTLTTEFPDPFVTQVYNYLSLGFPALARKFDDELAKISGIPIAELREDDRLVGARGYLRLGEGEVSQVEEGVKEWDCRRWCALRVYCREWGRQMGFASGTEKGRALENPHRAWGWPSRKGSWGN